jgi:hypothetical protein
VLSGQGQYFEKFPQPIKTTRVGIPADAQLYTAIESEMVHRSTLFYLQRELDCHLQHKRFWSAFHLFSWLRSVLRIPNSKELMKILDEHFPSFHWMAIWKPNMERIDKWEHGEFTAEQALKLSHIFDLDGPDIATHQQESLKMAEPRCYDHVQVDKRSVEALERLLDLLFRAHSLGPGALELFIHLCIDTSADEAAWSIVDDSIQIGDDSYCHSLSILLLSPKSQSSLSKEMDNWIEALPILNDKIPEKIRYAMDHLANHLYDILQAAQVEFCLQLKSGTGEYIGMRIYELGISILQATGIHSTLPAEFLAQIR